MGATENYLATGNSVCGEEKKTNIGRAIEAIEQDIFDFQGSIDWASRSYKVDYEELKEAVKEIL